MSTPGLRTTQPTFAETKESSFDTPYGMPGAASLESCDVDLTVGTLSRSSERERLRRRDQLVVLRRVEVRPVPVVGLADRPTVVEDSDRLDIQEESDPADVERLSGCRQLGEEDACRKVLDLDVEADVLQVACHDLRLGEPTALETVYKTALPLPVWPLASSCAFATLGSSADRSPRSGSRGGSAADTGPPVSRPCGPNSRLSARRSTAKFTA